MAAQKNIEDLRVLLDRLDKLAETCTDVDSYMAFSKAYSNALHVIMEIRADSAYEVFSRRASDALLKASKRIRNG